MNAHFCGILQNIDGEEKTHTVFQIPANVPDLLMGTDQQASTFNILMVDVSGSMRSYWKCVVTGWNDYVAPYLVGRTNLFGFGSKITLKRSETKLKNTDFDGTGTDLTGALQTIVDEVYTCKERYIKVFLITDGAHNETHIEPDSVIDQMSAVKGKICDVFVLGVGLMFPVQYSINIRSRLHNGCANMPSLFWAKNPEGIAEQMKEIGKTLSDGTSQTLKLSVEGFLLPGWALKNTFHAKEWVYFPFGPEQLKQIRVGHGRNGCHISPQPRRISIFQLNEVFRQWNSVIIQIHNKKENVPSDILPFMERILNTIKAEGANLLQGSIRERLERKEFKTSETEVRTLLNKI